MFNKILIANRGEIACRIIKTAQRMGIKTVAVYSDADANALHVRLADEAIHIGAAQAAQSYLNIPTIIKACQQSGSDAVHPGYGFLSENAAFATALKDAGITFIGPTPKAMAALGDKISSKKLAQSAGVSIVPGFVGALDSVDDALRVAHEIGYPIILKASAGGGGKGMRIIRTDDEMAEGLRGAQNEAQNSFADGRVFIERYIENPRHIEIQILGDTHGNVIALGERECTLQRRHQKVVEEAPSPFLDEATRATMCAQAVQLAKAAGYTSAGTVEFIVAPDRSFYFLEMNTRLQVEHPVTELITGLDLVEWMIRIANGEAIPFETVPVKGHALEVRVYAEDPSRGFLPSTGRLTRFRPPEHIRLDTGVYEGAEITPYYDPMIAKLISFGNNRLEATSHLATALDEFEIEGVQHNLTFLAALIRHPRFASFDFSTSFLGTEYPHGFTSAELDEDTLTRLLMIVADAHIKTTRSTAKTLRLLNTDITPLALETNWQPGQHLWRGQVNGISMVALLQFDGARWHVRHKGTEFTVHPLTPRTAALMATMPEKSPPDLSRYILSPMPGLLLRLDVKEGDAVKAGQVLAVVEAMKMENILRAPDDATVAKIHATPGSNLSLEQIILEFAPRA